jgi:hypothetical protein
MGISLYILHTLCYSKFYRQKKKKKQDHKRKPLSWQFFFKEPVFFLDPENESSQFLQHFFNFPHYDIVLHPEDPHNKNMDYHKHHKSRMSTVFGSPYTKVMWTEVRGVIYTYTQLYE